MITNLLGSGICDCQCCVKLVVWMCLCPIITSRQFSVAPSASVLIAQTTVGKRVSNTSCNRTFTYAELRSAWTFPQTCLCPNACILRVRLSINILECKSEALIHSPLHRVLWRGYLRCLCYSDYGALGRTGHCFFFHRGHCWEGWEHQPQTSSATAQLQQDLPAAWARTLFPQQQQEDCKAMPLRPTLPF